MVRLEKYTGTKTYMAPSGALMTPERMLESFPAIMTFTHVIETDKNGQMCLAINNLSMMRDRYNIEESLSEDEAIAAIQTIMNTESEPTTPAPTAEERTATALETIASGASGETSNALNALLGEDE